jgi:hypothetical protein
MINKINKFLENKKLRLDEILYDDYNLSLIGKGWSLNTTSAWRIIISDKLFGVNDSESIKILQSLIGLEIKYVEPLGDLNLDFTIVLENKAKIQIFSTTYFEPWIIRIEGLETIVASYKIGQS